MAKRGQICHKIVIFKSLGSPDPTHPHLGHLSEIKLFFYGFPEPFGEHGGDGGDMDADGNDGPLGVVCRAGLDSRPLLSLAPTPKPSTPSFSRSRIGPLTKINIFWSKWKIYLKK